LDPGNGNENLKGPAQTAPPPQPPPDAPPPQGAPGVVGQTPAPETDAGDGPAKPAKPNVKSLAVRGSAWAITGNLTQQSLRFASNLLLTRLLLPEAFGLMTIVNVVLTGLQMFSDIGIGPSIIQHKRGEDPDFYNTAWTVQIVRGLVLFLGAVFLVSPTLYVTGLMLAKSSGPGGTPVYADPMLFPLIVVGALSALIGGFNSTKFFTANRRLTIGTLTIMEIGVQAMGVAAMASWAWYYHSVWALVGGSLVTAWMKMLLTHSVLPGGANRLHFEREAFNDLLRFGRWIFLSTAALFIAAQGDRLLLGLYVSKAVLGVYSIAYFLSEALAQMIGFVTRRVFLPAFSHVARDSPDRLRMNYYKVRLRLDALTLPAAGGLMVLGSDIVDFLYPDKYADAGWMLQILAIRVAFACTLPAAVSCLLAIGDSKSVFAGNLGKTAAILVGIPLGWHYGQMHGVVWVIALSELGSLPILWWRMARHGLLWLPREALAAAFVALGAAAGWLVSLGLSWL
jgi:O-antigen/teichoic acid export membrane protein